MWANVYSKLITVCLPLFFSNAFALTASFVPQSVDYIFYTFALCGIAFAALIIFAYKETQWLFYVLLSLLLVIHASSIDGSLAYFASNKTNIVSNDFILWVLPFLLTTLISSYGYLVIGLQIKLPHFLARFKQLFFILSVISLLFAMSTVFWLGNISLAKMWMPANILFIGMVICQFLPPLTWNSYSQKLRWFIRTYPIVVALVTVIGYWYLSSLTNTTQHDFNDLYRVILLLVAFFSLTIVIWQAFNNKQQKDMAELQAAESAKNEAEMKLALLESEQAYNKALDVAARHQDQLASVSHDLKQPISALRLAVEKLMHDKKHDAEKLSLAVDYIDSLSRSYLTDEVDTETPTSADGVETISTSMLINALRKMFESDAEQNNIQIRFFSGKHTVLVEPLSTMRIMTNLISNALKHAKASRILVGFRSKGHRVIFQVHDNGLGIADAVQPTLLLKGEKGLGSDGEGLGLGIVQALCEAQELPFELRSKQGVGTSIYVSMLKQET